MGKIGNNDTDWNIFKVVNYVSNPVGSNTSIDLDITDENFSDTEIKQFSDLYHDRTFLEEKRLFEKNFLEAIQSNDIEDFYYSFADKTFATYLNKYGIASVEWLNSLLLQNLSSPRVVCGVLKVLSNVEYKEVQSFGFTMLIVVMYKYNHDKNIEVTDLLLSCIENWDNPEFLEIINSLRTEINFIEVYKRKILKNLAA